MINKIFLVVVASCSLAFGGGHKHHKQEAHVHGVAELNIVLSANKLGIEIDTPSFNILGFGHKPETKKEKDIFKKQLRKLRNSNLIFIPKKAQCALVDTDIEANYNKGTHSDIEIEYEYECKYPRYINLIDIKGLFEKFNNFEKIKVQWVHNQKQGAKHTSAKNTIVNL